MPDDKSKLLDDVLKQHDLSWPREEDFEAGSVIRPAIADKVLQRLNEHRWCLLIGPPRSAKTTLACIIGREIGSERHRGYLNVRYLDLALIDDPNVEIKAVTLDLTRDAFFIVDNCHIRPECHEPLAERIGKEWRGARILYVFTRFSEDEYLPENPLPQVIEEDAEAAVVSTKDALTDISHAMIDRHVLGYLGLQAWDEGREALIRRCAQHGLHVDEADYGKALATTFRHIRLRGNLRFLSWRLRAWDPHQSHLRDVHEDAVLKQVEYQIVIPSRPHTGSLEQVAALAQWEITFRRAPSKSEPEGIQALEGRNLVAPVEPAYAWRMDSTDAYLVMAHDGRWLSRTEAIVGEYLKAQGHLTGGVVRRIASAATSETKQELIAALLGDREIADRMKADIVTRVDRGELTFTFLEAMIRALLRDLPPEPRRSKAYLDRIAEVFLRPELGRPIGVLVRERSPASIANLFPYLKNHVGFSGWAESFLDGLGEERLVQIVNVLGMSGNRDGQDRFLQYVGHWNRSLRGRVMGRVRLVQPSSLETVSLHYRRFNIPHWLQVGSVQQGTARRRKIEFLAKIDRVALSDALRNLQSPADWVQRVLHSALWLSPEQAGRLAVLVSEVLTERDLSNADARSLSFLVNHYCNADHDAGREVAELVLSRPLHRRLPAGGGPFLGVLLRSLEKGRPGAMAEWLDGEASYLAQCMLSMGDEEALDDLVITLAFWAPGALESVMAQWPVELRGRLLGHYPSYGPWPRYGALAISDESFLEMADLDAPDFGQLSGCPPTHIAAALYGAQHHPQVKPTDVFSMVEASCRLWPAIALHLGTFPWQREGVFDIAARFLRSRVDPRTNALHNLVLLLNMSPPVTVEWPQTARLAYDQEANKVWAAAIDERVVYRTPVPGSEKVSLALNQEHPFVRESRGVFENVLTPLRQRPMTIGEWAKNLSGAMSDDALYYWRAKLLQAGVVACSLDLSSEQVEAKFTVSPEVPQDSLNNLVSLPLFLDIADRRDATTG